MAQCYGYLVTDATPGFPSTAAMEWPIRGQCVAVLTNKRLPHKVIEMSISCQVLMRVRNSIKSTKTKIPEYLVRSPYDAHCIATACILMQCCRLESL